jgi:hypothetical protein
VSRPRCANPGELGSTPRPPRTQLGREIAFVDDTLEALGYRANVERVCGDRRIGCDFWQRAAVANDQWRTARHGFQGRHTEALIEADDRDARGAAV